MKLYSLGTGCYPYSELKDVFDNSLIEKLCIFKSSIYLNSLRTNPLVLFCTDFQKFSNLYLDIGNWKVVDKNNIKLINEYLSHSGQDNEFWLINEKLNFAYAHFQFISKSNKIDKQFFINNINTFIDNKLNYIFILSINDNINNNRYYNHLSNNDLINIQLGLQKNFNINIKTNLYIIYNYLDKNQYTFYFNNISYITKEEQTNLKNKINIDNKKYHNMEYYIYNKLKEEILNKL